MNKSIVLRHTIKKIDFKIGRNPKILYNTDIHKCEIGLRHCDIFSRFPGELQRGPKSQGFITSKGRFVTREEGEKIARNCGQITGKLIGGELTSEDLY